MGRMTDSCLSSCPSCGCTSKVKGRAYAVLVSLARQASDLWVLAVGLLLPLRISSRNLIHHIIHCPIMS